MRTALQLGLPGLLQQIYPSLVLTTELPLSSKRRNYSQTTSVPNSEADLASARRWIATFTSDSIPRDIGDVSFSRSSGPGGQNVNKVSSKAQLRVPVDKLFPRIPSLLHSSVMASRYYAEKSRSLLIQADESRKQTANREACYRKLHELVVELARDRIPGETSESQKDKVKQLKRSENEARLRNKKQHSYKKASRSKSHGD
ncbi:hypothetical protein GJ744_012332 [Endocarpon pusillum]|uniref:Prokaryotic-type class I peptide chain release factors domain-containing protein n=1 Tax=Endocarpon pusillum TaxID=364733 RepID=A0A8H7AIY0_9EURO|nr:hypothetical protein GJ744_012332 [Endocarpon pusillum]